MRNLNSLLNLLSKWKAQYIGAILLLIFGIFFRSLEPMIIQILVDYVLPFFTNIEMEKMSDSAQIMIDLLPDIEDSSPKKFLLALALLYIIFAVCRGILVLIAKALNADASESAIKQLRDKIFGHIQRLPMAYFSSSKTGEMTQRATGDIETVKRFLMNQVVEVIRLSAIFIFSFIMMYRANSNYALLAITFVPFIIISTYIFFKKEKKIWRLHEDESDKLNNLTQENLNGIRVVKAFAQEENEIDRFEKQNKNKFNIAIEHAKLHTFFWPFADILVHGQIILSIIAGGIFAVKGFITIGELMSFYTYAIMVAWPLRQASRVVSEMGMALVAMDRIQHILDAEEEDMQGAIFSQKIKGNIEFRNVSFRYSEQEEWALQNVNFKINAGENVTIFGPTGAGKSTIIKLLMRLYEPTSGEIFIDNIAIKEIAKKEVRQHVGVALQKAFLFSNSIEKNIGYVDNEPDFSIVESKAKTAGLGQVNIDFVEGFETKVGEKGVSLSGGQKQRVSLARTLYSNPSILILDDVTSAVDTITESEILQGLKEEGKRTCLNITHRLSATPFADKIMVVENGTITGLSTHNEMCKENKYYSQINAIQLSLEEEIDQA
ncbi:MAG: ABC transporter ATP-binding protein [Chitinophagales bacterium]